MPAHRAIHHGAGVPYPPTGDSTRVKIHTLNLLPGWSVHVSPSLPTVRARMGVVRRRLRYTGESAAVHAAADDALAYILSLETGSEDGQHGRPCAGDAPGVAVCPPSQETD